MTLNLQVKVPGLARVPFVGRVSPVVIELLLAGRQQEENYLKKRTEKQCIATTEVCMGGMDTGKECIPYGMKWECLM